MNYQGQLAQSILVALCQLEQRQYDKNPLTMAGLLNDCRRRRNIIAGKEIDEVHVPDCIDKS